MLDKLDYYTKKKEKKKLDLGLLHNMKVKAMGRKEEGCRRL